MSLPTPADVARSYLRALETRAPVETVLELLHEDAIIEVLPNLLDPRGSRRGPAETRADIERGRTLLRAESYEVTSTVTEGDRAVLEVTWTAVLAVPLGTLAAGASMRARCSMHFTVREGRIAAQRNYDCFEALGR